MIVEFPCLLNISHLENTSRKEIERDIFSFVSRFVFRFIDLDVLTEAPCVVCLLLVKLIGVDVVKNSDLLSHAYQNDR